MIARVRERYTKGKGRATERKRRERVLWNVLLVVCELRKSVRPRRRYGETVDPGCCERVEEDMLGKGLRSQQCMRRGI